MIALLLTLIITTTVTPADDVAYLGALLCGEACGMPDQALQLVAESIAVDYIEHGIHWLPRRWYARPKPNEHATDIMRQTLELETFRACRLVGSGSDWIYWSENGYLPPDAVPDYLWQAHGMTVAAFGCVERAARVRPVWSCEGDKCPL